MAALVALLPLRTVVGLRAPPGPWDHDFVQALLNDGYVGEVLSTTMIGLGFDPGRC